MKVIEVQFNSWDKIYYFQYPAKADANKVNVGVFLVVKTILGLEVGKVVGIKEITDQEVKGLGEISDYIRIANDDDLSQLKKNNADNDKRLELCRQYVKKNDLQMK